MSKLFICTSSGGRLLSASLRRRQSAPHNSPHYCQFRFFSEGGDSDRIHSTDIAFKPNASGWGGSSKYESRWNDIFGNKKKKNNGDDGSCNAKSTGEEGGEVHSSDGTKNEHNAS